MKKSLRAALNKNGNRCHLCGHLIPDGRPKECSLEDWKRIFPTRDHIVPKSAIGKSEA